MDGNGSGRIDYLTSYMAVVSCLIGCCMQAIRYGHINLASVYAHMSQTMLTDVKPGAVIYESIAPLRDMLDEPFGSVPSDQKLGAAWQMLLEKVAALDGVTL